ncbi:cytochrome c family protein [Thermodesulfobacterium sp. TA1]|uniref:multiheme c-type cytochrome n=1 Tax=Thermodesulfobacterium sp. TA1 TaxID=2234087 RepID=UPI001231A4E7|nr:multiheme c-type cytochrome [Thermodesulfobacterium sp. TA1]QER42233.1 cytochrome c family protein [Thermodesulfobacterium sp. TA1]
MKRKTLYFSFLILSLFLLATSLVAATSKKVVGSLPSKEDFSLKEWKQKASFDEYCMSCHKIDLKKNLKSGETLDLKVNLNEIKQSVHGKFQCIICHSDFSKTKHPTYNFKNKREYAVTLSKTICQKCHTDASLKRNPVHYNISKTASCIECHGYHGVKPAKIAKHLPENQYCLTCHSRNITKKFENGEVLSVRVDGAHLLNSVHKDLKCSDCHKGYSKTEHPIKKIASLKEYRKQAIEVCKQCHTKETEQFNKSIHAKAFYQGKENAPDCLKCHDYHKVARILPNNELKLNLCASCHGEEAKAYKESIHFKALSEAKPNAPNCSNCHKAHDVLPINMANLNDSCLACHKDSKKAHNKWLYNPPFTLESFVDVHFKGSSCSACHAKGEKAVILTLVNKDKKTPFTIDELSKVLNWDVEQVVEKIDFNKDGLIQEKELWEFLGTVKQKVKVELKGRIDITNPNDAHKILSKKEAIKDCAVCHSSEAKFVGVLEINKEGEKTLKTSVDRKVLNSFYAIPNVKDFYVLGLSRISVLDVLFVLAVVCGLGFGLGHLGLRIITTPIRRKRREGK